MFLPDGMKPGQESIYQTFWQLYLWVCDNKKKVFPASKAKKIPTNCRDKIIHFGRNSD